LQQLQNKGHKPAPPTAYRALDFLVSAKLVHRLESMNAYIGCPSPGANHQCQFYICERCGHAAELHSEAVSQAIESGAQQLGFIHNQPVIEVHGICQACAKPTPS
jgi:Fur family zinc uptake transcriptional regulator